ncbi:MAG: hypothetical protein ACI9XB_004852 [Gammaproteobacteria bacterium]
MLLLLPKKSEQYLIIRVYAEKLKYWLKIALEDILTILE